MLNVLPLIEPESFIQKLERIQVSKFAKETFGKGHQKT